MSDLLTFDKFVEIEFSSSRSSNICISSTRVSRALDEFSMRRRCFARSIFLKLLLSSTSLEDLRFKTLSVSTTLTRRLSYVFIFRRRIEVRLTNEENELSLDDSEELILMFDCIVTRVERFSCSKKSSKLITLLEKGSLLSKRTMPESPEKEFG